MVKVILVWGLLDLLNKIPAISLLSWNGAAAAYLGATAAYLGAAAAYLAYSENKAKLS